MKNFALFVSKQKLFIVVAILAIGLTAGLFYMNFGQVLSGSVKLVQGFPILPVYSNAVLIKSAADPNEGVMYIGKRYSATWSSKTQVSDISKWYLDKLKSSGWTVDTLPGNPEANDIQLITLYNDKYSLNMSFIRDQNLNATTITAEFSTKYTEFCKNTYGKPCTN